MICLLYKVGSNLDAYNNIKNVNTGEERISSSYLVRQVKTIYKLKKYVHFLTFVEKVLSDVGLENFRNRKKVLVYIHVLNELELNFFDVLREIASTIVFEEEDFVQRYLNNGLTKVQLMEIKNWDVLESQKRWCYENGREINASRLKKLEKSKRDVYHSFL